MGTGRHRVRLARIAFVAGVLIPAACYKPNVVDGGLRCSDGGMCPEGFHCAGDGLCRQGATMMCTPPAIHVDPICDAEPGNDCDPICQSRCQCGRCNLSGMTTACTAPGAKARGDICNLNNDDCAAGNVCLSDCGGAIGRCYRFCGTATVMNAGVCDGVPCDITVNDTSKAETTLTVCDPPLKTCNPAGDGSDCGNPALGCYIGTTGGTVCDCRGTVAPGAECAVFNSCTPGYRCIQVSASAPPTCLKTCMIGGSDCGGRPCMSAGGGTFGFCAP